jgi:cytochrome c553
MSAGMQKIVLAAALAALPALALAGGNAASGKAKAAQVCAACHGPEGNKPSAPDQPVLAGQYPDYLIQALTDYKSGKRSNPIMKGFAGQLSKQDMEDLAAWFSSQQSSLHSQR